MIRKIRGGYLVYRPGSTRRSILKSRDESIKIDRRYLSREENPMKPNTKLLIGAATGAVILGGLAFILTRPSAAATPSLPANGPGPGCPTPGSLGVNNTQNQSVPGQVDSAQYTLIPGHSYLFLVDTGTTSIPSVSAALSAAGLTGITNPGGADPCATSFNGVWSGAAGPLPAITTMFAIRTVIDNTTGTSVQA
jgi:hypothetical protein